MTEEKQIYSYTCLRPDCEDPATGKPNVTPDLSGSIPRFGEFIACEQCGDPIRKTRSNVYHKGGRVDPERCWRENGKWYHPGVSGNPLDEVQPVRTLDQVQQEINTHGRALDELYIELKALS